MCSQQVRPASSTIEPSTHRDPRPTVDILQPLTSFVGRTTQLSAITALLLQPGVRLLTLAGPAGVGKTRLAVAAATAAADAFPDGVHFVSLVSLRAVEHVPFAIAEALGVHSTTGGSIESRVVTYARERTMLLVLDNLEHLLPLPFLTRLLTACPHITLFATSREVLHLSGEFEYVVPPMDVPDITGRILAAEIGTIESVDLFISRARQVHPDFTLTDDIAADIAGICARLDGLPLAIELAAARLKVFTPAALLARLPDSLSLLTGGPSDRPEHQRTIRDTIGWSHDLLASRDQRIFRRLAAFAGGISPAAAAIVCSDDEGLSLSEFDAIDELCSLVDKSLVQQGGSAAYEPRFSLLETVRHFATERLEVAGETHVVRLRHAQYFLELAELAAPLLTGPDQHVWTSRIDAEQVNVRAALGTFRDAGELEQYTRLACGMWRFWRMRGILTEGRYWLDPTLEPSFQDVLPDVLRSTVHFQTGWLALEQGDVEHAQRYGDVALTIARACGDDSAMARAYGLLSFVNSRLDDNGRAMQQMEASLRHHRAAHDADSIAGALNNLAILSLDAGEYEQVVAFGAESSAAFRKLGNLHGASHGIDTTGVALYCLGRFEEALRYFRESLGIDRTLGDKSGIAISLDHVGKCARALGDLAAAWEAHAQSLHYRQDLGDPRGLIVWLEAMALWLVQAGCAGLAARVLGAIEVTRTASMIPLQRHEIGDHEEAGRLARAHLGDDQLDTHLAKGRWLTLDEAMQEVRAAAQTRADAFASPVQRLPADPGDRFGLTPREQEVLILLARRYADKEIADALFISPRTVARHVTGIFTKLGVHSRREAAAMLDGDT